MQNGRMSLFFSFLFVCQNPSVDRSLKPVVIVAVGDVAFSLGGVAFAPFAPSMCQILVQAGLTKCEEGPPNWQVRLSPSGFFESLKVQVFYFFFFRVLIVPLRR